MLSLENIRPGHSAKVKKIHGVGALKSRIMDMGITQGTEIKIRKCAPLGDPIQLEVRGYQLSLRKSDAKTIEIFDLTENVKC